MFKGDGPNPTAVRARRVLAILGALVVSTLIASPPAAAVDGPTLTVGDTWTYSMNMSAFEGFELRGRVTLTVTARLATTVDGVSLDAFQVDAEGQGSAGGTIGTPIGTFPFAGVWELTGRQLLETQGLKLVKGVLDLRANGTVDTDPFPTPFALILQNTTTARILSDGWRFPHDVGDAAGVVSWVNATQDVSFEVGFLSDTNHTAGTGEVTLEYRLPSETDVTTPAGAFHAYAIEETWPDGTRNVYSYAPTVGNHVRTATYNATGGLLGNTELVSYRYQVLEPWALLGLGLSSWTIIAGAAGAGTIAAFLFVRRRRKRLRGSAVHEPTGPAGP